MFIGLYTSDQEKEKAIKEAIKKIDPNIEILDSSNCLEFTWDKEYLKESIKDKFNDKISDQEINSVLDHVTDSFLEYNFSSAINEEVEFFIDESVQGYKNLMNYK